MSSDENFFDPNQPDEDEIETQESSAEMDSVSVDAFPVAQQPLEFVESSAHSTADTDNLSDKFADIQIYEEIQKESSQGAVDLLQETTEAVHDLVTEPSEQANSKLLNDLVLREKDVDQLFAKSEMIQGLFSFVLSELKFDRLLEELLKVLMRSVNATVGSVLELDHQTHEFFFRAALGGSPDSVKSFRIPENQGIVGHVAESRQAVFINDFEDDQLQLKSISVAVGFEAKSCAAMPIVVANKLYGVLELFNKAGDSYFTEKDRKLLLLGVKLASRILEERFLLAELTRNKKV